LPYPSDFIKHALKKDKIDCQDLRDWCSYEQNDAMDLLSFLIRKHALRRELRIYRKTPPFIALLKTLLESGKFKDNGDNTNQIRKREY